MSGFFAALIPQGSSYISETKTSTPRGLWGLAQGLTTENAEVHRDVLLISVILRVLSGQIAPLNVAWFL